jgi:uncharacterized membrane protein
VADDREALARLEARVARLEAIVRRLLDAPAKGSASGAAPGEAAEREPEARGPARPVPTLGPIETVGQRDTAGAPGRLKSRSGAGRWSSDLESWIGQRALLAVGVVALVAAGGFFLNYAFERGWIPPALRATSAVLAGVVVATLGHRLIVRGLRRYGAALAGAGGALAYLGFWAAAAFALVSGRVALVLLLATTVSVAVLAVRHQMEPLAWWALFGAYFAPLFLGDRAASIETLLAYLIVVGFATGAVAIRFDWRATFVSAVAGYFLLPTSLALDRLGGVPGVLFAGVGGVAVLLARPGTWSESRLAAIVLAWWILAVQRSDSTPSALVAASVVALLLALVLWWQHRARDPLARSNGALLDAFEATLFVLGPLALALWSARRTEFLGEAQALVLGLVGLLYVAGGWVPRRASLVGMGFVLLALAAAAQLDGPAVAVAWAGLSALAAATSLWFTQPGGRAVAPALGAFAALQLFTASLAERPSDASAFVDPWSWGWYGLLAGLALAALAQGAAGEESPEDAQQRPAGLGTAILWIAAGGTLFAGGALELSWVFTSRLAGDLATSAFGLGYAAALVALGFRIERKPVRAAGLLVAGVAIAKIGVYDLQALEALYRVGSLSALALIALGVAYGYHQRAAARGAPSEEAR